MSLLSYILLTPHGQTFIPEGQEEKWIKRGHEEGVYRDWENTLKLTYERIQNERKQNENEPTNNVSQYCFSSRPLEQKNSGKRKRINKRRNKRGNKRKNKK